MMKVHFNKTSYKLTHNILTGYKSLDQRGRGAGEEVAMEDQMSISDSMPFLRTRKTLFTFRQKAESE